MTITSWNLEMNRSSNITWGVGGAGGNTCATEVEIDLLMRKDVMKESTKAAIPGHKFTMRQLN